MTSKSKTGDLAPDDHKLQSPEQLDAMRDAMRTAIEARDIPDIERVFLWAHQILTDAQVYELRYKREKNVERQRRYWEIGLGVERLRGQWLVDTEKAGLRYEPRRAKVTFGAPTGLITLDAAGQPPRIGIDRKKSQQLQALARLSEKQFKAVLADKTRMLTVAGILRLYAKPKPTDDGINPSGGKKRSVRIDMICADEQAQPRATLEEDRVAEYVEAMERGEKFPRLVLFQDKKGRYWLADGFHRFQAAVVLKRKAIECIVYKGELRDAILYSCGANATHGLPRTNADKHQAVTRLLKDKDWSKWSNVEISKRCRVSDEFVRKLRQQLELVTSNIGSEHERTYTDKHGNTATMHTGNIGRKPKPAASGTEPTPPVVNNAPDDVAQSDKPAPVPEPAAEPMSFDDDALAAQDLAPASKRDDVPPTVPNQPTPTPEEAAAERRALYARNDETEPDGDGNLPTYFGPKKKQLSLDEKVGSLIFLVEHQINGLVPEVRAAGRLPELFRRCRKVIDKLEAEAAADGDQTEAGVEPAAVDRATPTQEEMPPSPCGVTPPPL